MARNASRWFHTEPIGNVSGISLSRLFTEKNVSIRRITHNPWNEADIPKPVEPHLSREQAQGMFLGFDSREGSVSQYEHKKNAVLRVRRVGVAGPFEVTQGALPLAMSAM